MFWRSGLAGPAVALTTGAPTTKRTTIADPNQETEGQAA